MATINVNRKGWGQGATSGHFSTARTSAAASVIDGISSTVSIQYFSSGRGKRFTRAFLHFDTSGITGTLSAAYIAVIGSAGVYDPNDTIMIKSTAFGGDGGTALATSDFYSSLDYSTPYSSELTSWSTGNNEYTLTAAALADIKNNNDFTVAIINHDADFLNTDTTTVDDISVDFSVTITLDYTLAPTVAAMLKVNGVTDSNIYKVDGVTNLGSPSGGGIGKINGVTDTD